MEAKWGNKVVTGEERAQKPDIVPFINCAGAIKMLNKHITNKSNIAIHCDVDVDGIGTGYIIGRFIAHNCGTHCKYIINKDKVHGIQQKHADYFADKPLQFMIIVDSSSNEIDIIKQFNCDVLVIDHHEVNHSSLIGKTLDGHDYVIVNNTIDNSDLVEIKELLSLRSGDAAEKLKEYIADDRMSCGLVVYELLRLYCLAYSDEKVIENMLLFQWAGVTLFTDSILLNTPRNQWYIENTIYSNNTETTLKRLMGELNRYKSSLDKSLINYTIAPVINKAIRASHCGDALNCVIFYPERIAELKKYGDVQLNAVEVGISDINVFGSFVTRDISDTDIHWNYSGVIASKILGEHNKNVVVYKVIDGYAEGSFRGRDATVDYRNKFDSYNSESWAQGHKAAFGFRCLVGDLNDIMSSLESIEVANSNKYLLTAGVLNTTSPGEFMIEDMDAFKRQGGIWKLGVGNSKVSSEEQILITVSASEARLVEQRGKLYIYNILGMQCKAFEPISKPIINIYVEYTNQIDCYIRA